MEDEIAKQVPYLTFTVSNFNPNHRIRFLGLAEPMCYLFDLSTAVGDDSFYVVPQLSQTIAIQRANMKGQIFSEIAASTDEVRLSFHESGAVNLHAAGTRSILRQTNTGRSASGLVARFIFNSIALFRPVSATEINSLAQRYTTIPVPGLWEVVPICLDIYQVDANTEWVMPRLADIMQVHVCVKPNRKHSMYHFLVWQHSKVEQYPAELVILYSPL